MLKLVIKHPFLLILLGFIFGILVHSFLAMSILMGIILGAIILGFIFFVKNNTSHYYFICVFLLFAIVSNITTSVYLKHVNFEFIPQKEYHTAYISSIPNVKDQYVTAKLHVYDYDRPIICKFVNSSYSRELKIGDRIEFNRNLDIIKDNNNNSESGLNYSTHMLSQGISRYISVSALWWNKIEGEEKSIFITSQKKRLGLINFLSNQLNLKDDNLAIISSLLLGYQNIMSDDLKESFRTTGAVHLLSVSGLHVGIIFTFILFVLSYIPFIRSSRILKYSLIIVFLIIYSFLAGLAPSIIRATIMLSLLCLSKILNRRSLSINNLLIAAFVMLLFNPYNIYNIGFQLSFFVVLFLIIIIPSLNKLTNNKNTFIKYISTSIVFSFVAQIAISPLIFYYFGTFPFYFIISNLIFVPYAYFLIISNITLSVLNFGTYVILYIFKLDLHILDWLNEFNNVIIYVFKYLINYISKLPLANITEYYISLPQIILCYIIIFLFYLSFKKKKIRYSTYAMTFVNFFLWI